MTLNEGMGWIEGLVDWENGVAELAQAWLISDTCSGLFMKYITTVMLRICRKKALLLQR